jgi:hypothetical protein
VAAPGQRQKLRSLLLLSLLLLLSVAVLLVCGRAADSGDAVSLSESRATVLLFTILLKRSDGGCGGESHLQEYWFGRRGTKRCGNFHSAGHSAM